MARKNKKPARSASPPPGLQTPAIQQALDHAVQHHTAGRLPEAERLYQKILQSDPDQPVALHMLGVIAHQVGKHDIAVDLITKALAITPDHAGAHNNLGNALLALGRRDEAVASYKRTLAIAPDHAGAHIGLGAALLALGKADEAVASYEQALAIKPDFADAHNNLGNALLALGRPDDAVASYHKALDLAPDYAEAHYNLANALQTQGKLDEAVRRYHQALAVKPDYAEAHHNLGNALKDTGKLDDAVARYHQALAIAPDFADAHYNLGNALRTQGDFEAAFQALQSATQIAPGNRQISGDLIDLLNYFMPKTETPGAHVKAQAALQAEIPTPATTGRITDDSVRRLYEQCHDIVARHDLGGQNFAFQSYRGIMGDLDCIRHFVMFDRFNAIPEFCFGCFKVSIAPRTVVELLKLMLVFDRLELPNDNTRKCHVEVRQQVSGAYKGVIYCGNRQEGEDILKTVQAVVGERISKHIPLALKRGCSEFPVAHPAFSNIEDDGSPVMAYKEEWREHETYTDKYLVRHIYPPEFDSHNHAGFTLRDAVIMRSWLAYAAAIGDSSYRTISETVMQDVPVKKRPPFEPPEDD